MINYSTYMWKSPLDETAKEQAYAKNQVTKVMSFDDFVKHISDHNGVFTRGTVKEMCIRDRSQTPLNWPFLRRYTAYARGYILR